MKPPKKYPLSIWTYLGCYAASWGHHQAVDFLYALAVDHGLTLPSEIRVVHGYARLGFSAEGPRAREIYNVSGPGRGVRPITEVEW